MSQINILHWKSVDVALSVEAQCTEKNTTVEVRTCSTFSLRTNGMNTAVTASDEKQYIQQVTYIHSKPTKADH